MANGSCGVSFGKLVAATMVGSLALGAVMAAVGIIAAGSVVQWAQRTQGTVTIR